MGKPVKRRDEKLLREIRDKRYCECCGRGSMDIETHHIFGKGAGGWKRLDMRETVVALCLSCHTAYHNGRLEKETLLAIAARREGTTVEAINEQVRRLLRGEE